MAKEQDTSVKEWMEEIISNMFKKPAVLLDPKYGLRVFGQFFKEQLVNSTTTAVMGTFALCLGSIIIINCRATPGCLGRRLGFHYLGLGVAVAFAFPLQCGLHEHPKEAPADIVLIWVSTLIAVGIGGYALFVQKSDEFIGAWYFLSLAAVPLIYEPFIYDHGAQAKSQLPYFLLGVASMGAQVFLWYPVYLSHKFNPFATWFTCSIFWDLVITCICSSTWVLQYTGSYKLGLLTLVSPGTGLPLAMAKMLQHKEEAKVAAKAAKKS